MVLNFINEIKITIYNLSPNVLPKAASETITIYLPTITITIYLC